MFENWIKALGKLDYIQGKDRPKVDCIFCSVRDNDEKVKSLKIYEDKLSFILLNLYPYNPAHLLIIPKRHITKFLELTKEELIHITRILQGLQLMINDLYQPKGYNIGINQGKEAGGSIEHLHFHIVPRFGDELGFIDIFGKTRVVIESLEEVKKKVEDVIHNYLNKEFFKNF